MAERLFGVLIFGLFGLLFGRWTLQALRTGHVRARFNMFERATQPILFRIAVGMLAAMTLACGYAVAVFAIPLRLG